MGQYKEREGVLSRVISVCVSVCVLHVVSRFLKGNRATWVWRNSNQIIRLLCTQLHPHSPIKMREASLYMPKIMEKVS